MAVVKRIVCLANSRKLSGRCIAGIELSAGKRVGWIRPVSARERQEVSEHERQYVDGSDPRVLDVMDVPLIAPKPNGYQRENWLLDPDSYWQRVSRLKWRDLGALEDPVDRLWKDGESSYNGMNDRISLGLASRIRSSLRLIRVDTMTLSVFKPGEAFGNPKRRVQGWFKHAGVEYHLWVTDPAYERKYLGMKDGEYKIGESYLTISLGEPHEGYCYKLIAAIIERIRDPKS